MNTKTEIDRLTSEVCERLGMTLLEVMDVRVDLSADYLNRLVRTGWLDSPEDAQLMVTVPEYWAWWCQRWANRDREILENTSKLSIVEWERAGGTGQDMYHALSRPLAGDDIYPNDVIMAAFQAEKRKQTTSFSSLKTLFNS